MYMSPLSEGKKLHGSSQPMSKGLSNTVFHQSPSGTLKQGRKDEKIDKIEKEQEKIERGGNFGYGKNQDRNADDN